MKSVSGKRLCRVLEEKGWILRTVRGSHHVYTMPGRKERISIPVHGSKDLKTGLLKAIMKMAGIEEDDL
jgi:predicted RNA binding protein YcfA (HicA-like mRNA interferase family)